MELTFVVVDSQLDYHIDLFLRIKRAGREPATVAWYETSLSCYREATGHLPDWPPGLEHVFVSFYQKKVFRPWTGRGIRTRLRYWQKKAGVPRFCFNAFRHAYAVYSLRNKADLLDIKTQMGHKSIRTTARYAEVVNEERKERHRRTSPRGNL